MARTNDEYSGLEPAEVMGHSPEHGMTGARTSVEAAGRNAGIAIAQYGREWSVDRLGHRWLRALAAA